MKPSHCTTKDFYQVKVILLQCTLFMRHDNIYHLILVVCNCIVQKTASKKDILLLCTGNQSPNYILYLYYDISGPVLLQGGLPQTTLTTMQYQPQGGTVQYQSHGQPPGGPAQYPVLPPAYTPVVANTDGGASVGAHGGMDESPPTNIQMTESSPPSDTQMQY